MEAMAQISDAELKVMKILWETGDTTSAQIIEHLSKTSDWKPKTIHTLIARLVEKKAINAKRIDGKSYLYSANVAEEDYKSHASKSFLKQLFNGSINLMVANYVKEQKLTKTEIDELRKLLDEEA